MIVNFPIGAAYVLKCYDCKLGAAYVLKCYDCKLFQYPLPRNRTEVSFNQTIRSELESYGVCNETRSEYGIDESEGYAIRNHQYYWIFVFG